MRLTYILSLALIVLSHAGRSQQRYFIEKGNVSFFSDGVIEDIAAANNKVTSIFDAKKGDVAYLMNIKDFQFEKRLMQVHFNEKYMESEKFPKSSFQGKIEGFNPEASGVQQVKAIGKLTIHGVTRDVTFPGTAEVKDNILVLKSKFTVKLLDYNIKVPQIVWQNIAQQVEVTVDFNYRPL
ncbi:YceI family protein [Ohtaekwangia sp.]|uniref:YceI family protein n=1 Tax=Ohtaekwangia sp. TaxID=2066019 RepID=UPI002F921F81